MAAHHRRIPTALGPLTLVGDADAVTGLYFPAHWTDPDPATWGAVDDRAFPEAERELREYFAGERTRFTVPIRLAGTSFQRNVWALLRDIPHGETTTYRKLAAALGRPGHARAVGSAVRTNPISVIVPCHRVLGSSGSLTGYAGGLERKAFLLAHEGARGPRAA